jgi:hypothetical protein
MPSISHGSQSKQKDARKMLQFSSTRGGGGRTPLPTKKKILKTNHKDEAKKEMNPK